MTASLERDSKMDFERDTEFQSIVMIAIFTSIVAGIILINILG